MRKSLLIAFIVSIAISLIVGVIVYLDGGNNCEFRCEDVINYYGLISFVGYIFLISFVGIVLLSEIVSYCIKKC